MKRVMFIGFCCFCVFFIFFFSSYKEKKVITYNISLNKPIKSDKTSITISAVGDCTIGTDTNFSYTNSLNNRLKIVKDYAYFFDGVYEILNNDDLTIANLEGTFTNATVKNPKTYNFKGDKDFVNILVKGSVEAVNVANNHTYDYRQEGYNDTIDVLKDSEIEYFGYENYSIIDINGIIIGLAGISMYGHNACSYNEAIIEIDKAVTYFDGVGVNLKIFSFHWGIEKSLEQNSIQIKLAHYAIDQGVDLILGHHPHVLQGIEKYNGKYIVYSLANFVFGGNSYPYDRDSMIFQIKFNFENKKILDAVITIIPVSITSSDNGYNDYRPKILTGSQKTRVLKKIMKYSNISYK